MSPLNIADPDFAYDPTDPEPFRAGMLRIGRQVGSEHSGISVYELPPGQAICPYHYEHGEEEWLLVLAGTPTLRTPGGEETLTPWDVAFFPRGPEGAHLVRNDTADTVRVLMFGEVTYPTVSVYPDSGKVGIWTRNPDDDRLFVKDSAVDYFHGEAERP